MNYQDEEIEINLLELAYALWRKAVIVICATIVAALAFGLYSYYLIVLLILKHQHEYRHYNNIHTFPNINKPSFQRFNIIHIITIYWSIISEVLRFCSCSCI